MALVVMPTEPKDRYDGEADEELDIMVPAGDATGTSKEGVKAKKPSKFKK